MIKVQEVKSVELYTSLLFKDYYAVDVFVERGDVMFKIRYPYNLQSVAEVAAQAIKNKQQQDIPTPNYKPCIWMVEPVNKRAR